MRISTILHCTLSVAVVLLGLGFLRSSRALSLMQSDNARLKAELEQRANAAGRTRDVEQSVDDAKSIHGHQLSELNRLRAEVAAYAAREHALTNLVAESAARLKKLEQLERESAPQETNKPATGAEIVARNTHTQDAPALVSPDTTWSQEQIDAYRCANNLLQINLASTFWAQSHDGHAPGNFVSLHEHLAPMTLICPSRRPRALSTDWQGFDPSAITYAMSTPNAEWGSLEGRPTAAHVNYVYCPFHQIVSMNYPRMVGFPSKYRVDR